MSMLETPRAGRHCMIPGVDQTATKKLQNYFASTVATGNLYG
jgi:hypothetical protein